MSQYNAEVYCMKRGGIPTIFDFLNDAKCEYKMATKYSKEPKGYLTAYAIDLRGNNHDFFYYKQILPVAHKPVEFEYEAYWSSTLEPYSSLFAYLYRNDMGPGVFYDLREFPGAVRCLY